MSSIILKIRRILSFNVIMNTLVDERLQNHKSYFQSIFQNFLKLKFNLLSFKNFKSDTWIPFMIFDQNILIFNIYPIFGNFWFETLLFAYKNQNEKFVPLNHFYIY